MADVNAFEYSRLPNVVCGASRPMFSCSVAPAVGVVVDLLFSFFAVRSPENVDDTAEVEVCERHPDDVRKVDMNNINSIKNDDFIIAK